MEDVVAIRFHDATRGEACVMSWGRLFDPVDPGRLLDAVSRVLHSKGFPDATDFRVCRSLRDAAGFEYFFEALIRFGTRSATEPVGKKRWKRTQRRDDALSRSLYLLGELVDPRDHAPSRTVPPPLSTV